MRRLQRFSKHPAVLVAGTAIVALLVFLRVGSSAGADANVETAEVVIGDFVDSLTFRGEIKATRSALVTAPSGAGDLQIVKLSRAGVPVSRGDTVVQFDGTQVQRTLQEKRTALRQAEAEIEKARAQAKIDQEATRTEQMKGQYDVERAKLDVGTREVVSTYDAAKAELSLSDAQQRVKEVGARLGASQASQRAELQGLLYKREKAAADVALAEKQIAALTVTAPVSGPFMVQNLWRGPGMESEYREGDRAWSGAIIAEIPDPSQIYLAARVDEADRGRLKPQMTARVTSDSLPGVEFAAKLVAFSTLARPDYTSWPPPRNFDVMIDLDASDARLKPGMTTGVRVAIDTMPNAILIPTRALIQTDGQPVVYVVSSGSVERRPVTVARRGQKDIAIAKGLQKGERVVIGESVRRLAAAEGGTR